MIKYLNGTPSAKAKKQIEVIISEITDIYSDVYITKDNLRLFLNVNLDLFFECLKKGDKLAYSEEDGLALATGWSDQANRIYIKILAKNEESANKLLKTLIWKINDTDLYIKIKKNNPINSVLKQNGFRFLGDRGKETLFIRKKGATNVN